MKAREVLRRYAAGERDFRRANLRGQSFKGQNLAGADFSEADIRGANFTQAVLRGANFTKAQAGVQKRWWWWQQILALLISALASFLSTFSGVIIATLFTTTNSDKQAYFIAGIVVLGLMVVVFGAIAHQGFTTKTAGTIATAVAVAVASFLLGLYCRRRAFQGDANFAIIRSFAVAFQALGGTAFCGADLTQVNFSQARLKSTNFNDTKQQPTILA
jgi:uncharacterized protein YjbI with pentapeptide repeats